MLGLLVGVAVGVYGPDSEKYTVGPEAGYLAVLFAALGLLLAGVLAVLLDRRR